MKRTYNINIEMKGLRLDKAISMIEENLSRVAIQRLIDEKQIKIDGKIEKASYKIKGNEQIEINIDKPKEIDLKPQNIPLDVIYEDDDIIVINKKKGMCVHPGNGNQDGTLVNAVMAKCKNSLSGIGGEIRPGIVHRLDKDTSGIIIVAKNDIAHINLAEQIKNRKVKKTYIALVRGVVKDNEATINMPIARSKKNRQKMAIDRDGKEAITHFKVIKRFSKYTLLEVKIDTGRTHQIRVHMAEIGYPLIGDEVYSNGKNEFGIRGQCLHAQKIEFIHPITGEKMAFEAKIPDYFEDTLKKLE